MEEDIESVTEPSKGTCQWILGTASYTEWAQSISSGTLLLTGKMGSGKTVLTKSTIRDLQQSSRQSEKLFLYYFCSRVRRHEETADLMLRTLIYQILNLKPHLFSPKSTSPQPKAWPVPKLWRYLWSLVALSGSPIVYCVLDALDECDHSSVQELLRSYSDFCREGHIQNQIVRFLITLRHGDGPVDGFTDVPKLWRIHISADQVQTDIKVAMEGRIRDIISKLGLGDDSRMELSDFIGEKADGMFLWAQIVLDRVSKSHRLRLNFNSLLQEIANMPEKLDSLYKEEMERVLSLMEAEDIRLAKIVLAWILLARRPITVQEIVMALSVDQITRSVPTKREQCTAVPSFISTALTPFIEIFSTPTQIKAEHISDTSTIRIVHESARQFLWDVCLKPYSPRSLPQLYIGESAGHEIIARACNYYLRCSEFSFGWIGHQELNEKGQIKATDDLRRGIGSFLASYQLFAYISEHYNMVYHVSQCDEGPADVYDAFVDTIIQHRQAIDLMSLCRQYLDDLEVVQDDIFNPPSPMLHFTSATGSIILLERYVRRLSRVDWNQRDAIGRTVLAYTLAHAAADDHLQGIAKVAHFILQQGVEINAADVLGRTAIFWAARNGHAEVLRSFVLRGYDIKGHPHVEGNSLVHVAVAYSHLKVAELLLDEGVELDLQNIVGETALHFATRNGNFELAKLLMDRGANVAIADNGGLQPLHIAVVFRFQNIAQQLIEHHAPVNASCGGHGTALHAAAEVGSVEMIQLLHSSGAEINARSQSERRTPLHIASQAGQVDAMNALIKLGAKIDAQDQNESTALWLAAGNGYLDAVNCLINAGADVQLRSGHGSAPIHQAVLSNSLAITERILESNHMEINAPDKDLYTPLHYAVKLGNLEIVSALVRLGVDMNEKDELGETPLHAAASLGSLEIVDFLVKSSADYMAKDKLGRLPIHHAACEGNDDVVSLFLRLGINPNLRDLLGGTVLHCASANGSTKCIEVLISAGAQCNAGTTDEDETPLHVASAFGHSSAVRLLLLLGAVFKPLGTAAATPLHVAASGGHLEVAQTLLELCTNINLEEAECNGMSPLFLAVKSRNSSLVELLLNSGADVNTDQNGKHVLVEAARANEPEILRLLLEKGANTQDSVGERALLASITSEKDANIKVLLDNSDFLISMDPLFAITAMQAKESTLGTEEDGSVTLDLGAHLSEDVIQKAVASDSFMRCFTRLDPRHVGPDSPIGPLLLSSTLWAGKLQATATLLENGVVPENLERDFRYMISVLREENLAIAIQFMTERNLIDLAAVDESGWTVAHLAVRWGDVAAIQLLHANGADLSLRTLDGSTALHLASLEAKGANDKIRHLIDGPYGQNVETPNNSGYTPLHVAVLNGNLEAVQCLISQGADIAKCTNLGSMALHLAVASPNIEVLGCLMQNLKLEKISGSDRGSAGTDAQTPTYRQAVEASLKEGESRDFVDFHGWTPLMYAVLDSSTIACKTLLEYGMKGIDQADKAGTSALHIAAGNGNDELVKLLLRYGANPRLRDKNGWRAVDLALRGGFSQMVEHNPGLQKPANFSTVFEYPNPTRWSEEDKSTEISISEDGLTVSLPGKSHSYI